MPSFYAFCLLPRFSSVNIRITSSQEICDETRHLFGNRDNKSWELCNKGCCITVNKDGNLIMHPIIYMKNFEILWHVRQSPTVPHDRNFYFVSCKILSKLFLFSEEVRFFFNGNYFFFLQILQFVAVLLKWTSPTQIVFFNLCY